MNRENFKAIVDDVDINGINDYLGIVKDYDIEVNKCTAEVSFELEPEARNWGIKGIYIFVSNVKTSIEWWIPAEDLSDEEKKLFTDVGGVEMRNGNIEGVIEIDSHIPLKGKEWGIESSDLKFEEDGGFSIDTVEIDLETMDINLS